MSADQQNQTVSEAYLIGIKEGRSFLRDWIRRNGELTPGQIEGFIQNLNKLLKQGFAYPMNDTFRGERDFWLNQLKSFNRPLTRA